MVIFETSLSGKFPEVLKYWDFKKNSKINLKPEKVSPNSSKKAHWICENNHEFEKIIANMVGAISKNSVTKGCKFCSANPKKYGLIKNQWKK